MLLGTYNARTRSNINFRIHRSIKMPRASGDHEYGGRSWSLLLEWRVGIRRDDLQIHFVKKKLPRVKKKSGIGVRNTSTLDQTQLTPACSFTFSNFIERLALKAASAHAAGTQEARTRSTLSCFGIHHTARIPSVGMRAEEQVAPEVRSRLLPPLKCRGSK